jgi:hypothetical protein
MKKLYKVKIGEPTGGGNYFSFKSGDGHSKIKQEYFVVAKSFNEAGKMVVAYIDHVISNEKSSIRVTEYGLESLDKEINVCAIELVSDELINE